MFFTRYASLTGAHARHSSSRRTKWHTNCDSRNHDIETKTHITKTDELASKLTYSPQRQYRPAHNELTNNEQLKTLQ